MASSRPGPLGSKSTRRRANEPANDPETIETSTQTVVGDDEDAEGGPENPEEPIRHQDAANEGEEEPENPPQEEDTPPEGEEDDIDEQIRKEEAATARQERLLQLSLL
ncbi:unnamed protein product [Zymoseptoria tritici ST99CH_1E4]|uniref:Uncharacterized protein n=1 Tax=Zymoseptoria tritici ST99CH_1E4 TaxID=1276532 RepID=A0A2H1GQG1_ZYMTR|nr:unnamed protein product [Zymoseptoria tritici ST99CH_1E4]